MQRRTVTVSPRQCSANGERRRFALLRPVLDAASAAPGGAHIALSPEARAGIPGEALTWGLGRDPTR